MLSTLGGLMLALSTLIVPSSTAAAGGSLVVSPSSAPVGTSVRATGRLATPGVRPVRLLQRSGDAWVVLASGRTSGSGAYHLSGIPRGRVGEHPVLRVRAPRTATRAAAWTPRQVLTLLKPVWRTADAAGHGVCAIKTDRTLWCWGRNDSGQLGHPQVGPSGTPEPVPTRVRGSWTQVSTGTNHTCGIRSDSSLWCWGLNTSGQLGTGTAESTEPPHPIPMFAGDGFPYGVGRQQLHLCGQGQRLVVVLGVIRLRADL